MDDENNQALLEDYARTRDPALREKLVLAYISLVRSIVRRFPEYPKIGEDLLQVGSIGLIKAVDGFDPGRDVKFSTYATHCITGEVRHFLRDKADVLRMPRWMEAVSRRVNTFIAGFLHQNERFPSIEEISHTLNITREGVEEILRVRNPLFCQSYETLVEASVDVQKIKSLRYEDFRLPIEDRIVLQQAVERLRKLEQKIVYLFFYLDLTETQIAKKMGLSQKKVSRTLHEALYRMKKLLTKELW